jgi:RNA polymerase sigma factor FliA
MKTLRSNRAVPGARVAIATNPVSSEDVAAYMPVVLKVVDRFVARLPPNVQRDDLVCAGACGLVDALRRNSNRRSASFLRYAHIRVRGAVVDEIRSMDWLSRADRGRLKCAQESGVAWTSAVVPFDDLAKAVLNGLADESHPSPLEAFELNRRRDSIRAAMSLLRKRDRVILDLFYFEGVLLKDIAERLGVSKPRVSQLHVRAIARLRSKLCSCPAFQLVA